MAKRKFEVIHSFRDGEDKEKRYIKGDNYPKPANKKISDERIEGLLSYRNGAKKPVIKEITKPETEQE